MKKKYKTEFHIHTRYSSDSILSYIFLYMMAKLKKIDTLVITDHNEIKGAKKYKQKFKKHNIEVIIGEEIFTTKGEIIGLNLKEKIEKNLTPEETIKQIIEQGGLIYIPHPYDEKRYKTVLEEKYIEMFKDKISFIEVHNGRNISNRFDIKQNEIAKKYGITKIIGSDAHTFFEIGRNYILTDKKITSNNILKNYKDPIFKEKKCINLAHQCTKFARILKIITRGNFNELFRIINKKCKRKK